MTAIFRWGSIYLGNDMSAQLIVVTENGVDQALAGKGLNQYEVIDAETDEQIKAEISIRLSVLKANRKRGHVLVKWHNKLFICESKGNGTGYYRTEVDYHPLAEKFDV